ncbi:MAG TPA: STAS domain-containing protein [bacterium]|nr:STAS domain-containing protein [bacterium]HQL63953.1 STAS domain-containing protein [bacterium]
MLTCTVEEELGCKCLRIRGRIDGMTCSDLQKQIDNLILNGERILIADLHEVSYVSSAGLRVFINTLKQLKKVGGDILLYNASPQTQEIFTLSGLLQVFRLFANREGILAAIRGEKPAPSLLSKEIRGISIQYVERQVSPGTLLPIGSQRKLPLSEYTEQDIVTMKAQDIPFSTGLATIGENFDDYKQFLGESVTINKNFYFYPAVKRPAVDFMLCPQGDSSLEYKFLHGFGFNGSYNYILTFDHPDRLIQLTELISAFFEIAKANMLGIVLLAESKGLWGMHLKNVPILENKPSNGREIFDSTNFAEWVNFPVEASDYNHVVIGVGIAIKDKNAEPPALQELLAKDHPFHLHGAVFAKEALNKNLEQFEQEMNRVMTDLEVYKVQHILGQTRFQNGMAGIIELKG